MPFQDVPGVALIELIFDQFEQTIENTLYVRHSSGIWDAPDMALVTESVAGWWNAELRPLAPNSLTLREVKGTDLTVEWGVQITHPMAVAGAQASAGLPTNATICVSFRTAMRGRNFRGRNYYCGLLENQVSGNTVSSTTLAAIGEAYATLPEYLDDSSVPCEWVVVSRRTENLLRPFGVSTAVNVVTIVDASTDSMRGRLTGRGN